MTTNTTTATWTKLRGGGWGIRVQGPVKTGERLTVTKRDGTAQSVTVDRILWKGEGVTLCSVAAAPRGGTGSAAGGGRQVCAECGRPGFLVADDEDGLMKHPRCCDIPPSGY